MERLEHVVKLLGGFPENCRLKLKLQTIWKTWLVSTRMHRLLSWYKWNVQTHTLTPFPFHYPSNILPAAVCIICFQGKLLVFKKFQWISQLSRSHSKSVPSPSSSWNSCVAGLLDSLSPKGALGFASKCWSRAPVADCFLVQRPYPNDPCT